MARGYNAPMDALPGIELVEEGIRDLARGALTPAACLVSLGAPRLRTLGWSMPEPVIPDAEHRLYALLAREDPDSAHARYNALVRRLVSYERAAACAR